MSRQAHNRIEVDIEKVKHLYINKRMTAEEISTHMGVGVGTIYNRLKDMNITRTNSESHIGKIPWNFKGRIDSSSGYILVVLNENNLYFCMTNKANKVYEHRLLMAQNLGRPLLDTEVVHHKDEDRANNRFDNLELFDSHSEHMKHHRYTEAIRDQYLAALKAIEEK